MQTSVAAKKGETKTRARAYVLLRTVRDCHEDIAGLLSRHSGVVAVDRLEGPPDFLIVMEAADRPRLAEAVMETLASIDVMIESVELLPVQDKVPLVFLGKG